MGKEGAKDEEGKGKLLVHILVCLFGITSWSIMNGLWVELPILVSHLPEGWTLPSYLTIISQLGNIGPLIFSFFVWLLPRTKLETPTSILVVGLLTLCALFYSFFWEKTAEVAGRDLSIAVLTLTMCQSIIAATSSMCYLGFMAHLKARYISSIFIGQGLSGLIPAFIAFGQGSGEIRCVPNVTNITSESKMKSLGLLDHASSVSMDNRSINLVHINTEPAFTVQAFFMILFAIGVISLTSLLLLVYHPFCRTEHVNTDTEENCQLMPSSSDSSQKECRASPEDPPMEDLSVDSGNASRHSGTKFRRFYWWARRKTNDEKRRNITTNGEDELNIKIPTKEHNETEDESRGRQLTKAESWYLLALLVWINALQTSYVLAIQVYSSLPYGLSIYNGVTRAENIVDPIACFLTFYVTAQTTSVISGLTLLGTLFTAYIITVAAMSPFPFLVHETMGGILVIAAWIMCTMFMVFSKVSIASVMRKQGRKSLMFTGASTQIGCLIGGVLAYCMINQLELFQDGPWC